MAVAYMAAERKFTRGGNKAKVHTWLAEEAQLGVQTPSNRIPMLFLYNAI